MTCTEFTVLQNGLVVVQLAEMQVCVVADRKGSHSRRSVIDGMYTPKTNSNHVKSKTQNGSLLSLDL